MGVNDHNSNRDKHPNGGTVMEADDSNLRIVGDPTTLCGCGSCSPSWIQCLANPKLFTAHCTALIAVMICSFAYLGGVLTTIERQFQLSSSESGTVTIINDVVNLSLVLFASYFGHDSHRPRWIGAGALLAGFGTFLLTMPHFASDPVNSDELLYGKRARKDSECIIPNEYNELNQYGDNVTFAKNSTLYDECGTSSGGLGPIWWIIIGNVLIGVGTAPLYPLITTYIDDAVGKRRLVSYMAFLFMAFSIGPSFGFLLSAQATKLYVDFDRIPADEIPDIEQYDPRWIGAWWLGFVFCGVFLMILGIPMLFYPRVMVCSSGDDIEDTKPSVEEDGDDMASALNDNVFVKKEGQNGIIEIIKGLMFTMKRLVTNSTLMFMSLAGSAETATIGIFAAFSVKYLQTQFSLSPGTSGMLVGGAIIPCNIVSNLIAAWLIRRFKLSSRQCALLVVISTILSAVLLPILITQGCDNPDTAGITVPYGEYRDAQLQNHTNQYKAEYNNQLISPCNSDCQCTTDVFQPICGSDGVTYISPCLAGCTGKEISQNVSDDGGPLSPNSMIYTNCSCIITSSNSSISSNTARPGQCPVTCSSYKLPLVIVLCGISFFLFALTGNPLIFILLRSVEAKDRSVALGLKSLITKVLGFFPSPVYFGAIINATCILWQYTCDERGACWLYDLVKYRYSYFGTLLVLRICGIFCYFIMMLSIKPEKPNAYKRTEEARNPDEDLQLKQNGNNAEN